MVIALALFFGISAFQTEQTNQELTEITAQAIETIQELAPEVVVIESAIETVQLPPQEPVEEPVGVVQQLVDDNVDPRPEDPVLESSVSELLTDIDPTEIAITNPEIT